MDGDAIYEREGSYRIPILKKDYEPFNRVRGQVVFQRVHLNNYAFGRPEGGSEYTIDERVGMISAITKYRTSQRAR